MPTQTFRTSKNSSTARGNGCEFATSSPTPVTGPRLETYFLAGLSRARILSAITSNGLRATIASLPVVVPLARVALGAKDLR